MRKIGLLLVQLLFLMICIGRSQTVKMPHETIDPDCELCHTVNTFKEVSFDHGQTGFFLDAGHSRTECRDCHTVKDFSKVESSCGSCHSDIHEAKLGTDCTSCHSSVSWTIFDIQEIHYQSSFPIIGRHALVDCQSCHQGLPRGDLSFNTTRCVECHQQNYLEVTNPNHVAAGLHTDCQECHQMNSWRPAQLPDHDLFFPIFSGEHRGQWDGCGTCHSDPNTFQLFTCLSCHEHNRTDMDNAHAGNSGYVYNSSDCYLCHPTGKAGNFVGHDALYFPIFTGVHAGQWTDCRTCHSVPTNRQIIDCLPCHEHNRTLMDGFHGSMAGYSYNSTDCYFCHPGGLSGQFLSHDAQFFPIFSGFHAGQWNDCTSCHPVLGHRKPITCITCHLQSDMDGFHGSMSGYSYNSNDCYLCHPTGQRGQFVDHDIQFFPIFSGFHAGQWGSCTTCHTSSANRKTFDCLTCHLRPNMDGFHGTMSGYSYNSQDCYFCHPSGVRGQFGDHDAQYFPIFSGTHLSQWNDCIDCHTVPTNRNVFNCLNCHTSTITNNAHGSMPGYSYSSPVCYDCHPTGERGNFIQHDNLYFPIFSGTHINQWNLCSDCHDVPGNSQVFNCLACHINPTTNNAHGSMSGYSYTSSACYTCHPTGVRGQFVDHDNLYFPIFSRKHRNRWNDCNICHDVQGDRTQFTCFNCHKHNKTKTDDIHRNKPGYSYTSTACIGCHPNP